MDHITQSYKNFCDCCAVENTTNECCSDHCQLVNICIECVDDNEHCANCAAAKVETLSQMRKCCLYRASVAMLKELEQTYDAINYRNRLLHNLDSPTNKSDTT